MSEKNKSLANDFDQDAWRRRQKQRNLALLLVLLGLVALFFAISIVQFSRSGHL